MERRKCRLRLLRIDHTTTGYSTLSALRSSGLRRGGAESTSHKSTLHVGSPHTGAGKNYSQPHFYLHRPRSPEKVETSVSVSPLVYGALEPGVCTVQRTAGAFGRLLSRTLRPTGGSSQNSITASGASNEDADKKGIYCEICCSLVVSQAHPGRTRPRRNHGADRTPADQCREATLLKPCPEERVGLPSGKIKSCPPIRPGFSSRSINFVGKRGTGIKPVPDDWGEILGRDRRLLAWQD